MNILIFVLLCSSGPCCVVKRQARAPSALARAQAKEWLAGTECLFCLISKPFKSQFCNFRAHIGSPHILTDLMKIYFFSLFQPCNSQSFELPK